MCLNAWNSLTSCVLREGAASSRGLRDVLIQLGGGWRSAEEACAQAAGKPRALRDTTPPLLNPPQVPAFAGTACSATCRGTSSKAGMEGSQDT